MSRIGKMPIQFPESVKVVINNTNVNITGPKGSVSKSFAGNISIDSDTKEIKVSLLGKDRFSRSMWGTSRSIINSMIIGVTEGFEEELIIVGVGYRALMQGKYLNLFLGKSHSVKIIVPDGIELKVEKNTSIKMKSFDKEMLGAFAALISKQRPVEPYKGKGIRKKDAFVIRKEGKKTK
jgi:large subunit ribosomal protein L6